MMANIDVLDLGGKKVGSLELAEEIFAPGEVNEALLWEAVKHYRAAMRQGTHATKNRKLVSGSGKKRRFGSLAAMAAWRHRAWTAASLLRLRIPEEEAAGRTARGACGEALGRQAHGD
jgi:hypothetical protein